MGRRSVAAALCVLVNGFVLTSPFVHAHRDDHHRDAHGSHSEHHSTAVHAHLGGHDEVHHVGGSGVGPEHHKAIYLPFFVSQPLTAFDLPIAGPQAFALRQPDETSGHAAVSVAHGHDPPDRSTTSPRAPPAFPTFI